MPQKQKTKHIFFSKLEAIRNAMKVQTLLFQNAAKKFAGDKDERVYLNQCHKNLFSERSL